jgi:methyl-accepting chemotaxis protein
MPKLDNGTFLIVFVALTGFAMLVQAIILLAIYLSARKAIRTMHAEFEDMRSSVNPLIENTRGFLARVGPKVEETATDLAEVAHRLRVQTAEVEASVADVLECVRQQTSRVDSMFSGALDTVDRVGNYVAETVSRPVRQVSGLLASIRAIVDSLRSPIRVTRESRSSDGGDNFV